MQFSHYIELLKYHIGLVVFLLVTIVGGVAAFSVFFLFVSPIYTGTAVVSLLPTQTELTFSQKAVRSTSINPANLLSQTHIEYLTSREVARLAVDRLSAEAQAAQAGAPAIQETVRAPGLIDHVSEGFRLFRSEFRRIYNTLNSGLHVPRDPYTDTVLSLQDSIEIEMIEGTYILEISVKWPTPEGAAAAANVLADVYVTRARDQAINASLELEQELRAELARGEGTFSTLEQQINDLRLSRAAQLDFLRVIDTAAVPLYPSFPKVVVNTVFAIVGWVFVATFAVIAIDTFSNTVKTRVDAMRIFDGRFLGRIHLHKTSQRQRNKASEILRRLTDPSLDKGGSMSLGGRNESIAINSFIRQALSKPEQSTSPSGNAREKLVGSAKGKLIAVEQSGLRSPQLNLAKVQFKHAYSEQPVGSAEMEDEPASSVLQTAEPMLFPDFGGIADDFNYASVNGMEWMVIGLRPGTIRENDVISIIEELQYRGVRHVFGIFLRG